MMLSAKRRVTDRRRVWETMLMKLVDPDNILVVHDAIKNHGFREKYDVAGIAVDDMIHAAIDIASGARMIPFSVVKITGAVDIAVLADKSIVMTIKMLGGDV